MKYEEAIDYLESRNQYGIVPGLDTMKSLLQALENPEEKLQFIHIAGTNGKGSLLAFLSTILAENGYTTGRYQSPTIEEYRDRFQVNGKTISKKNLTALVEQIKPVIDYLDEKGIHPTSFECETALSFLHFVQKKCQYVVLETGMGGLMDATNVVQNTKLAVFSRISMDHVQWLGNSLEEIAYQKAGIIKPGCRVVSMFQEPTVEAVLRKQAEEQKAADISFLQKKEIKGVHYGLAKQSFSYGKYAKMEISLAGTYQIENAALALLAVEALQGLGCKLTETKIRKAMWETRWSGRFQVLSKKPVFVVDGAHNAEAALRFRETVQFYFTNKRIIYIMGMFRDKDCEKVVADTVDLADQIITTSAGGSRALSSLEMAEYIRPYNQNVTAADSVEEAVELAYLLAGKDKDTVIIAFGSLAYLGRCMEAVKHRSK